ncbi:unnamed protein product [Paramecium primaurelia]|uniref:Uncharacterized protein n=1 Tax=Paramecium primaurelia TaxID=5886 RepID=A0A8S1Q2L3_PARPR|nr:unnamed protein product [Paramecium primaurelia]
MSYQLKGLNAKRLQQINQSTFKTRKSQDYPCDLSYEYQPRNNSFKQTRAITQHNQRLINEDEISKMVRPQTSEGTRRMRIKEKHTEIGNLNSNLKCDILECENEEDNQEQQLEINYHIICNSSNTTRSLKPKIPFQTTLDQDFISLFAND